MFSKKEFVVNAEQKKKIIFTAEELSEAFVKLKKELVAKKQATDIFGQERNKKAVEIMALKSGFCVI